RYARYQPVSSNTSSSRVVLASGKRSTSAANRHHWLVSFNSYTVRPFGSVISQRVCQKLDERQLYRRSSPKTISPCTIHLYVMCAISTPLPASSIVMRGFHRPCRSKYHSRLIVRSEEHTSELQSRENLVCRLLLEKTN